MRDITAPRWSWLVPPLLTIALILLVLDASVAGAWLRAATGAPAWYALFASLHVALIAAALLAPACRRRAQAMRGVWVCAGLYGCSVVLSSVRADPPLDTVRAFQVLLVPLTIAACACALPAILSRADYHRLLDLLTVVIATIAALSLAIVVLQPSTLFGQPLFSSGGRGHGLAATRLFFNPNAIGSFLQFFPALVLYRIAVDAPDGWPRLRRSPWRAGALTLISLHLVFTFSRSSQLVAIVSLIPVLPRVTRAARRRALTVAASGVAVLAFSSAVSPYVRHRTAEWLSLEGRLKLWSGFAETIHREPLFGTGLLGTFVGGQTPHNAYLAQLVYFGVVGLGAFLLMLTAFGRLVRRNLERRPAIALRLIVFLLIGALCQGLVEYIVTFPLLFSNTMFWLTVGIAVHPDS